MPAAGTATPMAMIVTTGMSTDQAIDEGGLARLLTWLSPAFPVGGYTYSHGLERAIEEGLVGDGPSLLRWIEGVLAFGAGRLDADLLREAWLGVAEDDRGRFASALAYGAAMRGSPELALESQQQGQSFLATVRACWPHPRLESWGAVVAEEGYQPAYPVAVGLSAAAHDVPLQPTLIAFLHGFAASMVSAAVRLVPLGQTVGQTVLAQLAPAVAAAARAARDRPAAELGSAAPMIDLLSIAHETQHVRLFRS